MNCSGLSSIIVDNGNTIYDSRNNCNAIIESNSNTLLCGCKNTIIPNGVTSIGGGAFFGCSGLTTMTIGNSVKSIGNGAFYGCSGLTSVTIGNSVTSIDKYAFDNCSNLTSVTSLNPQPPVCQTSTFSDYTIPLYVPQGSTLKYKAADVWRNFVIIRELSEEDDIYLTINDGAKGNVEIKVDKENPYLTLRFKPENGWRIYSVTLNGGNVTDEVDSNGSYSTPAINENSQLTIVYTQGSSSAPSLENAQLHFSSTDHSIVINGTVGGERISVCSIDGKSIANVVASGYTTEIPVSDHQVYLIKINNSVFKVSM